MSTISDWDDWSVGDQTEIDAMIDAYKKEEIALDNKDGILSQVSITPSAVYSC